MNITYWSDYACPYCYLGETYMKQAIAELGAEDKVHVSMKAFELNPDAPKNYEGPTDERFAKKYGLSLEGARERIDGISRKGHNAGLEFNYADTRYTNTFDAHRLTKLAQSRGDEELTDRLQEALFKAYFADSKELANHETLVQLATEAGLEEEEVRNVLSTDRFADEARRDETEAMMMRVNAVPYFVLNDKYAVPGALPVNAMKKALEQVLAEENAASMETIASGMTCGPDGCSIEEHRRQAEQE